MNRRNFLSLTGTYTGGLLVVPQFLHAFGSHSNIINVGQSCLVFIQLNGGNDGLAAYRNQKIDHFSKSNTFIRKQKITKRRRQAKIKNNQTFHLITYGFINLILSKLTI